MFVRHPSHHTSRMMKPANNENSFSDIILDRYADFEFLMPFKIKKTFK